MKTRPTFRNMNADELNAQDAHVADTYCFTEPGHRRCIYSDRTGKLRRIQRSPFTGRPIVEEFNPQYEVWSTVAFPSEAWAARHGLG